MARLSPRDLTATQVDALRSLAGFGAADAGRSLSQLLSLPVEMSGARASLFERRDGEPPFGAEGHALAVHFRVEGGAKVRLLVQFTDEGAAVVRDTLVGKNPADPTLASSALAEAANILVSSYLSGVGAAVGMTLVPSVPAISLGSAADAASAAFGDLDLSLLLVTELKVSGTLLAGRLVAAPEGDALESLLATLGAL